MLLGYLSSYRIQRDRPESKLFTYNHEVKNPKVSIIVPVYNQETTILHNLSALISRTSLPFELIVLNDASEDATRSVILNYFLQLDPPTNLLRVNFISFGIPRYETFCDDFGVNLAQGEFIIEVQADMEILEDSFDQKLINVLLSTPQVFMVSGRGIMSFESVARHYKHSFGTEAAMSSSLISSLKKRMAMEYVKQTEKESLESTVALPLMPEQQDFEKTKHAGRLGRLIEIDVQHNPEILYIGETVMRGPIAFSRTRYLKLGGLNTDGFFLGFDEHDLNLRAYEHCRWKAAYSPISFIAPLANGSMRKKRSRRAKMELYLAQKRIQKKRRNTELYQYCKSNKK